MNRKRFSRNDSQKKDRRRGAMLVFVAVLIFFFLGIIAFSVDVAYMHLSRTQLQTATDAAARAAGETLTQTQDLHLARNAAKTIGALNIVDGDPLILDESDIINGHSTKQQSGRWLFAANGTPINSFRLNGQKTHGSSSGAVKLFFAPVFGVNHYQVTRSSATVRIDRDICLVVDRSSSMKLYVTDSSPLMYTSDWRFPKPPQPKSRWVALEKAVRVFNDALKSTRQRELVSLVTYASDYYRFGVSNKKASIDQPLTENSGLINTAMQKITARIFNGGTEISAGIDMARGLLNDSTQSRPFARKTIVLMTDGQQKGGRDPVLAAQDALAEGIVIYTITFGSVNLDQTQMKNVAAMTGGKHYHAPNEAKLVEAFREIGLALSVIITE